MRKYKIYHTDSFISDLFGGNPTITVLNADSLNDIEMYVSETGFILSSHCADFRLRFFTPPGNEIKFSGHATVWALSTIACEDLYGCPQLKNQFIIETNTGILNVEIDFSNPSTSFFTFDAQKIDLISVPYTIDQIASALDISMDLLDSSKSVMLEKTNNYLYFTARNLNCLRKIKPNMQKAIDFTEKDNIILFCILTNKTFNSENHIHARGFAPLVGVPEDPFTESMQGGLSAYALNQKLIPFTKWTGVEQGHFIERPGFVKLKSY